MFKSMLSRRSLCLSLTLILVITSAKGQDILSFKNYGLNHGFSANKANAIIQDRQGYIWIATWNGLNRYDGYNNTTFSPRLDDTTTISNREVVCLYEAENGTIWAGTTSGLNAINPITTEIKTYPFEHRILSIAEDKDNNIWLGLQDGGLYKLNPSTKERQHFLNNEIVTDICTYSENSFWIGTHYGLVDFNPITGSSTRYLSDGTTSSISNSTITQVKKDASNELWIGTWGGGINRLTLDTLTGEKQFQHYNSKTNNTLTSDVIYRIFIGKDNSVWCGTWDQGILHMKASERIKNSNHVIFKHFAHQQNNIKSISGNNVSAIFIDRANMLWVGAKTIDVASVQPTHIRRFKTISELASYNLENSVRTISFHDNNIWAGSLLEIYRYNNNLELVETISTPQYRYKGVIYKSTSILAIVENKHGMWVGTDDAGLLLYQKINNKYVLKRFFNSATLPAISGNKINNITISRFDDNTLWLGSVYNGICRLHYDGKDTDIKMFKTTTENGLSDNNIRVIEEDRDGNIWIGTQNGLNLLNPITESIKHYYHSNEDSKSINDDIINSICEDDNGNIWLGTNTGLNKAIINRDIDGKSNIEFKNYHQVQTIGNNIIGSITKDNYGQLWLKSYRELVRFDPYNERPIKTYKSSDYSDITLTHGASCCDNNNLYFGTIDGFISFNPTEEQSHSISPLTTITSIKVSNENGEETILLTNEKEITLTHSDRSVILDISAMDFKNPLSNNYAYYLEGRDDTWIEIGSQNKILLNNFKHGKYILHVKSANSDGIWSYSTTKLTIDVLPHWSNTIIAYLCYGFIFIYLLILLNKFSVIKATEKNKLMLELVKKEEEQKLNELKTLFFTDITHEFRTPLTLIQGPVQEILNEGDISPYVQKQANLIKRNSNRMLRLINQLMDFRKVDRNKMGILYQECNVTDILKDVYDGYKGVAQSRQIDFTLHVEHKNFIAYLDTDKIEKILFNLASNAFKYSEDKSKIDIHFYTKTINDKTKIIIEYIDEGIGIAPENQERVFERFVQTHQMKTHSTGGIGLYLSKTFVEQHGGTIELESEIGSGSCFRIMLPYKEVPEESHEMVVINKKQLIVDEQTLHENDDKLKTTSSNIRIKVLIVEDDYDLNNFMCNSLSKDYETISSYNGKDGFEMAINHQPELIISDVMMPEMDGFEMCTHLRNEVKTSHIPIIFLTAKTMQQDQIKGLELGAVDYINKPFNIKALKLKIQNIQKTIKDFKKNFTEKDILDPEVSQLSSIDEEILKKAVDAVSQHLDDAEFNVDQFANEIGLSANQAYRKIKALTGQTAKEFIRNQRLKAASKLFLQNKRSISEVIYMVGFSSPSYFTRCFKSYYNCTPKEYIEKNGIIEDENNE